MLRLAFILVFGACTSFDALDRGVCGNGLLETGEDCDSNDASCVRCAVVCAEAKDCPTADYACGVDGLCHAPGGVLGPPVAGGPFQVNDLSITDIDHDRIGDVVGVSRTSISVRYGEATARLTRAESLVTPSQTGGAAFGDLDGDLSKDVTIVTLDGMVSYSSRFGSLAPVGVSSSIVEGAADQTDLRDGFNIDRQTLGAFLADENGMLFVAVLAYVGVPAVDAPCGARLGPIPASAFSPDARDVYIVSPTDVVVSVSLATTPRKPCVLALHKPLLQGWTITDITPPNIAALQRRPVLADLEDDTDRCPGLVNNDAGAPMLRYWDGSMSAAGCTLQAVASPQGVVLPPAGAQATSVALGRIPLVPAIATAAADLLVMSDGIYGFQPSGNAMFQFYASQRRLSGVEHADLDEDGMIDAVLTADTEDDVEVFYRRMNSILPVFPGYVVLRLDTASRVVNTEIADYDGNGKLDLAIVEQLAGYQRLSISYGTADLLLPPKTISAFSTVISMASLGLPDRDDPAAVTDDLVVLQPPAPGRTAMAVTILSGGAQRSMTPYYDPRPDEDPIAGAPNTAPREVTDLRATLVGRFVGGDGDLDPIAFAVDDPDVPVTAPQIWRVRGTSMGPDATVTPGIPTTGFLDCANAPGTGLCVRDAIYLAWPISETRDVAIAVDRSNPARAVSFDPGAMGTVAGTSITAITSKLPIGSMVRALHSADLDGDGAPELVVSAGPRVFGDTASAVLVCQVSNGVPSSCEDIVPAIIASTEGTDHVATFCVDAAPARVSFRDAMTVASAGQGLVVACRDTGSSLYRVHQGAGELEVSLLARTQTRIGAVQVGDVTGDGLDDVVAIEGESGAQSLVVFAQCSSRNLAACTRGGGS